LDLTANSCPSPARSAVQASPYVLRTRARHGVPCSPAGGGRARHGWWRWRRPRRPWSPACWNLCALRLKLKYPDTTLGPAAVRLCNAGFRSVRGCAAQAVRTEQAPCAGAVACAGARLAHAARLCTEHAVLLQREGVSVPASACPRARDAPSRCCAARKRGPAAPPATEQATSEHCHTQPPGCSTSARAQAHVLAGACRAPPRAHPPPHAAASARPVLRQVLRARARARAHAGAAGRAVGRARPHAGACEPRGRAAGRRLAPRAHHRRGQACLGGRQPRLRAVRQLPAGARAASAPQPSMAAARRPAALTAPPAGGRRWRSRRCPARASRS